MRALVAALAALSLAAAAGLHCAQRREISPCTCHRDESGLSVICERVDSYARIAQALQGRFPNGTSATLVITHSSLSDLDTLIPLASLGLNVTHLKLNYDNISELRDEAFVGLKKTEYLSLADNELSSVPRHVLQQMPSVRTLDLGRSKIKILYTSDLQVLPNINYLMLAENGIVALEKNSLPLQIKQLHLGINHLTTLNGTIRNLDQLEWLMIHSNKLTTIENEIPMNANKLKMIHVGHNRLEAIPREIRHMPLINALFFYNNNIKSLNGALQKCKKLERLNLSFNKIKHLSYDDFAEAKNLMDLDLGHNQIHSLNGSLRNLSLLTYLNLTHNELSEFSMEELRGIKRLLVVDLSFNKITQIQGQIENTVDFKGEVLELRLNYNKLKTLNEALVGLQGLYKLNVSNNQLEMITPMDLMGLHQLRVLDISHNHITTLDNAFMSYLPALEELHASYNKITILNKDFHGLPVLCHADMSYNSIKAINIQLVTKTQCLIHGVPGTLKIQLYGNPVLCSDDYPDINGFINKFHVRFYGECSHHKIFTPTVVSKSQLNDIVPIRGGILLATNVVSLDGHMDKNTKIIGMGNKLVHIITGRNGDILVYPPITLPSIPNTA